MEKTLDTAKVLYELYYERTGERMDEMKMHKLLYFTQRESLLRSNEPLFDGDFYGWKFGPVLKEVRDAYAFGSFSSDASGEVSDETRDLLNSVLDRYGSLSAWRLSSLLHGEFSWKKARKGLKAEDNGDVKMLLDAMRVDAARERVERSLETE